jgi:hypothetical protein
MPVGYHAFDMDNSLPVVEVELPCAICGYNLKGLAPDANCPECGQSVSRTYTPELGQSDPRWLWYQAYTMLVLASLCLINYQPYSGYYNGGFQAAMILAMVAAVISVWGCWRLARPEPPGPPADSEATFQRALRIAPAIYALILIGTLVRAGFGRGFWDIAGIVATVSIVITNALVARVMFHIAKRTRDSWLILHARIVLWAFPLAPLAPFIFGFGMSRIFSSPIPQWVFLVISILNWILSIAVYATLLLMGRLHETLRAAAKVSEARVTTK